MRKPIEIDRTIKTRTPVTEDILEMLKKLATWKPSTLEQVIQVGERLIKAANDDIFYGSYKINTKNTEDFFKNLDGKMVKYPNGITNSTEYIFVDQVDFAECEWNMHVKLTGVRLSKHNRIGEDTVQVCTLPIRFNDIIDQDEYSVTISSNGFKVTYEVVTSETEYLDVYNRIHGVIDRAGKIPLITGKVNLTKKSLTNRPIKNDIKTVRKIKLNNIGKPWTAQPTSTTTSKETSKSCEVPSGTTSSSPETMAIGKAKRIRPRRVSATLVRKSSKKSPPSSKSS